MKVEHVVAGYQDSRTRHRALLYRCGGWCAELLDMTLFQHLHDTEVLTAAFQDQLEVAVQIEVDVGHRGKQGFLDKRVDLFIDFAQAPRVVCVCAHALDPIEQHLLK